MFDKLITDARQASKYAAVRLVTFKRSLPRSFVQINEFKRIN